MPHTQVAGTPVHAQVNSSSFDAVWHASPYSSRALLHNLKCTILDTGGVGLVHGTNFGAD